MPETAAVPLDWPGKRLGLPAHGPGSIARLGRRVLALCIDWAISLLIANAFLGDDAFAPLLVFVAMQVLLVMTIGSSIGHTILGLRVVRLGGGYPGLWRPIVRALLIALVIPAVIWDRDQRGMHDRLVGTVLLRFR